MSELTELELAHKTSVQNRLSLENSDLCGCFYCLKIFSPAKIEAWLDEDQTALCPMCGIDSLLTDKRWITKEFLYRMQIRWFGDVDEDLAD